MAMVEHRPDFTLLMVIPCIAFAVWGKFYTYLTLINYKVFPTISDLTSHNWRITHVADIKTDTIKRECYLGLTLNTSIICLVIRWKLLLINMLYSEAYSVGHTSRAFNRYILSRARNNHHVSCQGLQALAGSSIETHYKWGSIESSGKISQGPHWIFRGLCQSSTPMRPHPHWSHTHTLHDVYQGLKRFISSESFIINLLTHRRHVLLKHNRVNYKLTIQFCDINSV